MTTFARTLHVLLLGIWLGGALFFIGFAQKVSALIDSRHLAGDVITAALALIDGYGLFVGPIILVTLFVGWMPLAVPLRNRALGAVLMIGAVALSRYWVTPELLEAKRSMGLRLEHMDPSHPVMDHYQSLHSIGTALMLVHLVTCFFMLIAAVRSSRPRRSFGGIEL